MKLSRRLLPVVGALGIAALSACGTTATPASSSSGGGGGTSLASCQGTITVATDLPLTGGDATDGPPVEKAAHLAVTQANTAKTLGGCTLKYVSKDDATVLKNGHDPAQGAANITALSSDQSVVGVVGPFNSSVAVAEIPVASQNHLALISPSNTNPGLTQAGTNPDVNTASLYPGPHTYFRTIGTDITQGQILSYVAQTELKFTKAYAIDDQETYGRGLSTFFQKYFAQDGGTIVGTASLPGSTKDFHTQIADAQSKGAQVIFFGGTSGNGCGILRSQMPAGLPELGGDGCQDDKFITDAGSNSAGAEVTSAPDASKLSTATTFYSDFQTAYSEPGTESPYTPYGYDAMNGLIQAIKAVLVANNGQPPSDAMTFRDDVVEQLHKLSYSGATGTVAFDANGDTTHAGFSLYTISGTKWAPKELLTADATGKVSVSG
ncbi:MAG: branched-chain amino acid ABC transporter substrate-binding protein [Candidatus Dormibacteraeota bacterium]|nr:branched-chain amino acid ABC transporter substrate-binding protein [Candidatus Dormibacteraeota bacterium]